MAEYKSSYTGLQVDEAVGRVLNNNCIVKYQNLIGNISDNPVLQTEFDSLKNTRLDVVQNNGVWEIQKDGEAQTFRQVVTLLSDERTYVYLAYGNINLIPVNITTTSIQFNTLYSTNATTITFASNNNVQIVTNTVETTNNKVTTISANPTNTDYPSAKAVANYVKENAVRGGDSIETVVGETSNIINVKTSVLGYESNKLDTDSKLYKDVYTRYYSSFDIEKTWGNTEGNIEISNNGICSNAGATSLLKTTTIDTTGAWSLQFHVNFADLTKENDYLWLNTYNRVYATNAMLTMTIGTANTSASLITNLNLLPLNTIAVNKDFYIKVNYDNTAYKSYYKTASTDDWTLVTSFTSTKKMLSGLWTLGGYNSSASVIFTGNSDLKFFVVKDSTKEFRYNKTGVSSNSIPYTVSKAGIKITDVANIDKVRAEYEDTGLSEYYVIDEVNNASYLPMGDIYSFAGGGKANIDLDNVSESGDTKLTNSNAYLAGEITTENKLYKQVRDRYHDSFDSSVLDVEGTPTYSNNGILTFANMTNYLVSEAKINYAKQSNYRGILKFKVSGLGKQGLLCLTDVDLYIVMDEAGTISFCDNSTNEATTKVTSSPVQANTYYYVEYARVNNVIFLQIYDEDWKLISTVSKTLTVDTCGEATDSTIRLGAVNNSFTLSNTELDLKEVAFYIEEEPVFNCNNMAYDVIKSGEYTKIGQVNVSKAGIASNFSINSYIVFPKYSTTVDDEIKFEMEYTFPKSSAISTANTTEILTMGDTGNSIGYRFFYNGTNITLYANDGSINGSCVVPISTYLGKHAYIEGTISKTKRTLKLSLDKKTWTEKTNTSTLAWTDGSNIVTNLSHYGSTTAPALPNYVDLSTIKFYVNNEMVYQPCIIMPCTISTKGDSISDSFYRGRLQEVVDLDGSALYYTIDEVDKNVTLPKGDLYGLIDKVSRKYQYKPNLLDFKWADHQLNDVQWLRGDTFSWQDGVMYELVYNELVDEYRNSASTNETESGISYKRTPKGYKIALATQEDAILNKYVNDGVAWYYILDTENVRFRLPRTKFGFEGIRTTVGSDIAESLPNITGSLGNWGNAYMGTTESGAFKLNFNVDGSYGWNTGGGKSNSANFSASRSSSSYKDNAPVQERSTQMYLYFYVGEFTQTSLQQTAGLNAELFNNKADAISLIGKANTNFNNVSATGKSTSISWGMPDYSAGVDYANDTTVKTAPSNGVLVISYHVYNTTTGYFKINGETIAASYHNNAFITSVTGQYMLSKGDTFQITSVGYNNSPVSIPFICRFYPCKGAN